MNCSELFELMISHAQSKKLNPHTLYYFVVEEWERITFCLKDDNIVHEELDTFLSVAESENRVKEVLIRNGIPCNSARYTHSYGKSAKFVIPFSFTDENDIAETSVECYYAYVIDP